MANANLTSNEPPEFIPMNGEDEGAPPPAAAKKQGGVDKTEAAAEEEIPYSLPTGKLASELFKREKVPSDFVLPGFVAGTVGALIAPGSTGKSMLAMELAAVVAGANIFGAAWPRTKIGEVLILAVEDPENELFNRWSDLGSILSQEDRKAGERVRVIPMLGERFDIMRDEYFYALMSACSGKRLLILDTMRRIHTLDENDGSDMSQVIGRMEEIAKQTGCSILFLHHTGKAAALNGQGDIQQASRGSSVLVDNIRYQMFMVGMNKDDEKSKQVEDESLWKNFVRFGVSKVNYGAKMDDVWLRRVDGGILVLAEFSTSSITQKKPADAAKKRAKVTTTKKQEEAVIEVNKIKVEEFDLDELEDVELEPFIDVKAKRANEWEQW